MRTKFSQDHSPPGFSRSATRFRQVVIDWVEYLQKEKLFGPADPLFPATLVGIGEDNCFQAAGLSRSHWSNATPIRKIFKEAF